jgi:uncharacterized protein (TIGR01244 family)
MSQFRDVTPNFAASPQISLEDVATAANEGFKAIICNRPDGEENGQLSAADIAGACQHHGLTFTHIPVAGGMSQVQIDQMAAAIETANGPVLAYCRSGTRSTNLWAMAMAANGDEPEALVKAVAGAGYDLSGLLPSLRALGSR